MQIDLANTLVHKAYFIYYVLLIIAHKFALPSFGGAGGGSYLILLLPVLLPIGRWVRGTVSSSHNRDRRDDRI